MAKQHIYHSPYPTPHVPTDLSVPEFLLRTNPDGVHQDKVILEDFEQPGGCSITYGELRRRAALQAGVLKEKYGIQQGDIVGLFGLNTVDWAVLCLGILWAGGTFCSMNPLATSHELVHYLELTKPKIIFADDELVSRIETAHPAPPFSLAGHDNRTIPAGIIFSSGTSGRPKAVQLSHHSLIAQLLVVRATNPATHAAATREVFFPSFAHIYGIVSGVLLPAWVGCSVVAMRRFDFVRYITRCSEIRATLLRLVPATAARLASDPAVRGLDLRSVKSVMCSGASLPAETIAGLKALLHPDVVILNGYGMSEGTISLQREGQAETKPGSIGRPAAGAQVRIVGDDGVDVAGPGVDGECYLRSPTLFMGYKDNPQETAATLDQDGWLRTGDVVRIDEDGDMWLTGRKKELIKYKGNQVAPAELEGILLEHELVADAGVCGLVVDGVEVPAACIVLVEHGGDTQGVLARIQDHLHERVAPYKRLRGGIYAVAELPKGSTGKLLRRQLPSIIAGLVDVKAKL
ncbi:hypothetical protein Micbo1qcDRAFT_205257 [Microdochium bolleyi]|uniref:Uncharacterized protein n=1 Tax=Microdochium bolleyi TaxID=196109 RepID=A0A136J030_9PEZI|nr:hypothetical protein Micbo1qcDRAFT_205257 [Microdochium bolleyi]